MPRKDNKQISFYVSENLHKEIKNEAISQGKTMKQYILDLHREAKQKPAQESILIEQSKQMKLLIEEIENLKGLIVEQGRLLQKFVTKEPILAETIDEEPIISLHEVMSHQKHPDLEEASLHDLAKGGLGKFITEEKEPETIHSEDDEFTKLIEEALEELEKTEFRNLDIMVKDSSGKTIQKLKTDLPKPNTKPIEDIYTEEFTRLVEEALKNL